MAVSSFLRGMKCPGDKMLIKLSDYVAARLADKGVVFTVEPMDSGPVRMAVFDDTCGNLIQLIQMVDAG